MNIHIRLTVRYIFIVIILCYYQTMENRIGLVMLVLLRFLTGVGGYIFLPFLPTVGKQKHLTATQIGVIISSLSIITVITAPIIGKGLPTFGCKFTLILGGIIQGLFSIAFGALINLPDGSIFFAMSFIEASLIGLGMTMTLIACDGIVAIWFSSNITTVQGIMETAYYFGATIGPVIGGFLFDIVGYQAIFYATGFLILLCHCIVCTHFPPVVKEPTSKQEQQQQNQRFVNLIKPPKMLALISTLVLSATSMSAVDILLPIYFHEDLNVSISHTGLAFLAGTGVYLVGANIVGYWYRIEHMKPIYLIGLILLISSYLLMGLTPLMRGTSTQIWLTILSLVGIGIAVSMIVTPGFENLLHIAMDTGHTDNIDTYSKISTCYQMSYAIGDLLGPLLGGILLDNIGYQWTVIVMASLMIPVLILYTICA